MFLICFALEWGRSYVRSAKLNDVQTAVKAARDGDSLLVPVGTATWASTLKVSKNITKAPASQNHHH